MKKILGIVFLGLLLSVNAYASCSNSINASANKSGDKLTYSFSNNSDKGITITKFGPKSTSGKMMRKGPKLYIPAFGKRTHTIYLGDLNLNVYSKQSAWNCIYTKSKEVKFTPPKIKECKYTEYEEPCTCEKEPNSIKKKYCELRVENANKMTRSEAAGMCARRAEEYSKEVGAEYYKDCMKDEGF